MRSKFPRMSAVWFQSERLHIVRGISLFETNVLFLNIVWVITTSKYLTVELRFKPASSTPTLKMLKGRSRRGGTEDGYLVGPFDLFPPDCAEGHASEDDGEEDDDGER